MGDAEGIRALSQLRYAQPVEPKLITGVKRASNYHAMLRRALATRSPPIMSLI